MRSDNLHDEITKAIAVAKQAEDSASRRHRPTDRKLNTYYLLLVKIDYTAARS